MSSDKKLSYPLSDFPFYLLCALIAIVPLVFTTTLENGFTLTKAVTLKVIGGIFIIAAVFVLIKRLFRSNDSTSVFVFERKIDLAVFFFLGSAVLSTIFSIRPQISYFGQLERQIGLVLFIYLALIFFFASQIIDSKQKIRTLFLVIEITGIVVSLYGLMQLLKLDPFEVYIDYTRPVSTLGHGIFLAGFLLMAYPVSLFAALEKPKSYLKFLSPLIITFGIVAAQSRTVYIAWIVVTCIMFVLYKHITGSLNRKRLLKLSILIIAAIALGIIIFSVVLPENIYVKRFYSIAKFFDTSRVLLWRDSFKVFAGHPVIGSGIETFSYVFEKVASPELRKMEVERFFDNAHSNFVQTLCTMGIIGAATYIALIIITITLSLKMVLPKSLSNESRMLALPLLGTFIAYFIYGIADFDNNVILLYLFVFAAILKSLYVLELAKKNLPLRSTSVIYKTAAIVLALVFVCFVGFNIYKSYNDILADRYFQTGKKYYAAGNFSASVEELNKSVLLNYVCPEYKFTLAAYVYDFAVNNSSLTFNSKQKLLKQAEEELNRAEVNFQSVLQCEALRAVIYLEEGKEHEAGLMISEVLQADTFMITLRNNLAAYYLKKQDYPKMKEQLDFLDKHDPQNITTAGISLNYYLAINDTRNAILCCEKILKFEPDNVKVKIKLEELRSKKQ